MHTITSPFARAFVAAALLSGLAVAGSAHAAATSSSSSSSSSKMQPTGSTGSASATDVAYGSGKSGGSPEDAAARIETRIQTLHDKLKITPDQESEWNDVAQAMRDNESGIGEQIQARQASAKSMTAVEDLESYQKIAQAHADGIGKVISSFQSLYGDMSDEQKKNADQVFGQFEGHRGAMKASVSGKKKAGGSMSGSGSTGSSSDTSAE